MPLLEIGEIMIDEDEAKAGARIDEIEIVACPTCDGDLVWGASFCSDCGQKVSWFSQIVP